MTVEMAADCVKACNNAANEDCMNTPMHLFEHFVYYFGWDNCGHIEMFAQLCGFSVMVDVHTI